MATRRMCLPIDWTNDVEQDLYRITHKVDKRLLPPAHGKCRSVQPWPLHQPAQRPDTTRRTQGLGNGHTQRPAGRLSARLPDRAPSTRRRRARLLFPLSGAESPKLRARPQPPPRGNGHMAPATKRPESVTTTATKRRTNGHPATASAPAPPPAARAAPEPPYTLRRVTPPRPATSQNGAKTDNSTQTIPL